MTQLALSARGVAPRFPLTVLELEETAPPRTARAAILMAVAMVGGFLAWAALFPVAEIASSRGEILPDGLVQPVQHGEGGLVAKILVRDGATVQAGEVLILLDGTTLRAEADQLRARQTALGFAAERLRAAAEGRLADLAQPADSFGAIRDSQAAMAEATARLRAAQIAIAESEMAARQNILDGLTAQLPSAAAARDLARDEVGVMVPMLERGLARRNEIHMLRQTHLRQEIELARLMSDTETARGAVAEAAVRRHELETRLRQESLAELARIEADRAETEAQLSRIDARLGRLAVVAPIAGVVKDISPRGTGTVIEPGATIAEIVPQDGRVYASAEMPAEMVGAIRPGQDAKVKVLTFDHTRFGALPATVTQVSASSFRRQDGSYFYRVKLELAQQFVGDPRLDLRLTPGMTMVADIRTGERTLLAWLMKPVRNALDTAFSER
jgi:HlyD family secretion protein/adhesin transport system membrane fusion protein